MRVGFKAHHFTDEHDRPAGGTTTGTGFTIGWQNGPLGRGPERRAPNGAFVEDIIDAARDRIAWYNEMGFECEENMEAIDHLEKALGALDRRTKSRESHDVEGTHERR